METSERIIANRYDGVALVTQGPLEPATVDAARREAPKFILARSGPGSIGWTRCNRGQRYFDHIVERLAAGRQPDVGEIARAGYILRNNGFWGNGRHGSAVFPSFPPAHPLSTPYMAEMFTLYLWRQFGFDLVEHVARRRNASAAVLDPRLKRYLGMGNASGLGMVPFIVAHPDWIAAWMGVREAAIAAAKARRPTPDGPETRRLQTLLERAIAFFGEEGERDDGLFLPPRRMVEDLRTVAGAVRGFATSGRIAGGDASRAWEALAAWAETRVHRESLELLHSLLIELDPDAADRLARRLVVPARAHDVRPETELGALRRLLRAQYGWAFDLELGGPEARRLFWYYSEENEEPRIGVRGEDPGEAYEPMVGVADTVQRLDAALAARPEDARVADFLWAEPRWRAFIARVQTVGALPYAEIRGNLLAADFQPCHVIRYALSLLGVEKFEAVSSKWVRGTFLQGAPLADDVAAGREGDWLYPLRPSIDAVT
jgi:hypothetical protein